MTGFGIDKLKGVTCGFETELFDSSDFDFYQIHQPEKISRAVRKRQAEFLAGRHCAALALNSIGLYQSFAVEIGKSREPVWPDGVVGSITHSGTQAAAIVGASNSFSGVGVDIENLVEYGVYQQISPRVLNKSERDLIHALDVDEALLFTYIFAVKEAFFKAVFPQVGTHLGFNTITVTSLPEEISSGVVKFELNRCLSANLTKGRVLEAQIACTHDTEVRALVALRKNEVDS